MMLDCRPTGLIRVDFHDGETFSFNPLVTTVQHLIVGSAYIDHYGTINLCSTHTALSTKVKFKEPLLSSANHKVPRHLPLHPVRTQCKCQVQGGAPWLSHSQHAYSPLTNFISWPILLSTMTRWALSSAWRQNKQPLNLLGGACKEFVHLLHVNIRQVCHQGS